MSAAPTTHRSTPSAFGSLAGPSAFVTTHWTVVLAAGRADTANAEAALSRLCKTYWYPLYAYVRRRGYSAEDAQDLTQEFFARLLARNWVGNADREKGRFRTFLLTAMSRFLADEWDKLHAQKRGGGKCPVPFQFDTAETRFGHEPVNPVTPEQCFERRWALTLLETVLNRLRSEYEQSGRSELFDVLRPCLLGEYDAPPYAQLGNQLGLNEGALKMAVHRLRKQYRQLLTEEIAHTVTTAEEVEQEFHYLLAVLAR